MKLWEIPQATQIKIRSYNIKEFYSILYWLLNNIKEVIILVEIIGSILGIFEEEDKRSRMLRIKRMQKKLAQNELKEEENDEEE